jgi:hypothetical protein
MLRRIGQVSFCSASTLPGGYERPSCLRSVCTQCRQALVPFRNPHPTGGVMLIGYAGPGWEWPKASNCNQLSAQFLAELSEWKQKPLLDFYVVSN